MKKRDTATILYLFLLILTRRFGMQWGKKTGRALP
jgi:hypothetical protein